MILHMSCQVESNFAVELNRHEAPLGLDRKEERRGLSSVQF